MKQNKAALALLIAQAGFLWFGSGASLAPLIAIASALAVLGGVRFQLPRSTQRMAVIVLAMAIALISRATLESPEESLAIFPIKLIRPLGDFFLVWQSLVLLRHGTGERLPGYLPFLALVTVFCAFDQSAYIGSIAFLAIAITLLVVASSLLSHPDNARLGASAKERRRAGIAVFLTSGDVALAGLIVWTRVAEAIRTHMPVWAAEAIGHSVGKQLYVRDGSLNGITQAQRNNPTSVVLRVKSDRKPGYLRGRVFDTYSRSRWRLGVDRRRRRAGKNNGIMTTVRAFRQPPRDLAERDSRVSTFEIIKTERRPFRRLEIRNDPDRGVIFFTPLGMNYVQGTGIELVMDHQGVVHLGLDAADAYTAFVSASPEPVAIAPSREEILLATPDSLAPEVAELAERIGDGSGDFSERVAAVETHFRENYEYEIGEVLIPDGVDPLSHFLLNPFDAHCEFFASGAVALLRLQQIPARYVTGYVVTEEDPDVAGGWLARNKNAHAWVEAYDAAKNRWVIVEATPGMDPVTDEVEATEIEDTVASAVGQWFSVARGSWADFLSRYTSKYLTPIGGFALVVGLVAVAIRRRRRESAVRRRRAESPELIRRRKRMRRTERLLSRRGFVRQHHETLHRFAARIAATAGDDPALSECVDECLRYAEFRYDECCST